MAGTDDSGDTAQKEAERKRAKIDFGATTVIGVLAGLLYGGSREAVASASKDAEVMLKLGSTADKREQYRVMRDAMEKRFIRVARGSILGGAKLGLFTACFSGLQQLLAQHRGVYDAYNVAGAGSATAAIFGLLLPGSFRWRARNVVVGSVLGAAVGLPLGWIQISLVESAKERIASMQQTSLEETEVKKGGVADTIDRLEKTFTK
ncbi:hypothetical protein SUGI_0947210 [Cryptomeria japonica]|uniref:uncharacterized protein LOC131066914 n=1 Tax=Cryptomeria japonica TaxID=3369 RepID=UPI002414CD2A|nr:uncharacterized protein LOC131066914 [Cryptomeria japonica]GLJ44996.1 hypothetical protein SUGI_0947210 [Cryptomeria japonica]